jgi:uncharacterized protein DUF4423
MKSSDSYARASRELVRAVRGKRSQLVLSRRLGYRGNPVTDWEAGRSHPDTLEVLEAARLAKLPVKAAFERFHPAPPPRLDRGAAGLAAWLDAVRGSTTFAALSARLGCSRYVVRRWFGAEAQIKLPAFLRLVDVLTDRVQDWVAELVGIERVPSLAERFERVRLAKLLAFELPWSEAVLRVLETARYRTQPSAGAAAIASWLSIDTDHVAQVLEKLVAAGVVSETSGEYRVVGTLSVDTRVTPDGLRRLRQHWLGALLERSRTPHPTDWSAYNVMSLSAADLAFVRERLQSVFREIRSRVAASEPTEEVALVMLQLAHWEGPPQGSTTRSVATVHSPQPSPLTSTPR